MDRSKRNRRLPYVVLSSSDIDEERRATVAHYAAVLGASPNEARGSLARFHWNADRMMYALSTREFAVPQTFKRSDVGACPVCGETSAIVYNPSCGHGLCRTCWVGYVSAQTQEGHLFDMSCAACAAPMLCDLVRGVLAESDAREYDRVCDESFLYASDSVRPCPRQCGRAVRLAEGEDPRSTMCECECGAVFPLKT